MAEKTGRPFPNRSFPRGLEAALVLAGGKERGNFTSSLKTKRYQPYRQRQGTNGGVSQRSAAERAQSP